VDNVVARESDAERYDRVVVVHLIRRSDHRSGFTGTDRTK